ncbi:hypothetical protein OH76DRAFT_940266 [Lentinus brumalis]|uniref:Uncharacterized protein n=1 Tax=Lentinus brumalis TaxID=2498619 RepID=A0A371CZG6_9APHY|nr:hypothetical protein OH76DRAFT_940266 [Polyporus brumalis]
MYLSMPLPWWLTLSSFLRVQSYDFRNTTRATSPSHPLLRLPPRPIQVSESSATYVGIAHSSRGPMLSPQEAAVLADPFAALIPNRAFSMATVQGYGYIPQTCPYDAVDDVEAWVERKKPEQKPEACSDAPSSGADGAPASSSGTEARTEEPWSGVGNVSLNLKLLQDGRTLVTIQGSSTSPPYVGITSDCTASRKLRIFTHSI